MNTVYRELEDRSFKVLYPTRYRRLRVATKKNRGGQKRLLKKIKKSLQKKLVDQGIPAYVEGREKHIYSIYRKMKESRRSFDEIMDVCAFKVVVDTAENCYKALGVVHSVYKPVEGRFKDYISIPKSNGYQSIHSGVIGLEGQSIEINIPTLDCGDPKNSGQTSVGLTEIATLLNLSSGIIKRNISTTAGLVDYRAASSAGALYPIETYLICGDLQDIPAGIYHFSPKDNVLIKIAEGDYRALLSSGRSEHQEISNSPIVLVYTSIIWRSTWKYRARGYRYSLWDNGTILSDRKSVV